MTREIRVMLVLWFSGTLIAFGLFSPLTAQAAVVLPTADPGNPCGVVGWYVNPDEANRAPARTASGFVFEDTDLIHHAAPEGLSTKDLTNGGFLATPLPDQDSFFSVEVAGSDGKYGTLRWNAKTKMWEVTTAGLFYTNADPTALADMPPVKLSHTVVSFGVGYTANPPGTVTTTVKSVSFLGKAYTFTCLPPTSPSPSPSASSPSSSPTASTSPTSSGSASGTASPTSTGSPSSTSSPTTSPFTGTPTTGPVPLPSDAGTDGSLPTTGASLGGLLAFGLGVLLAGGLITWWFRRALPGDDHSAN